MQVVCAWCQQDLPSTASTSDGPISHGMCLDCLDEALVDDTSLHGFLNRLHVPVVAVDATGCLVTASNEACTMLGQSPEQLAGLTGGDAFACSRARLPGGCGQTVHCKTCTIRQTVMATHATAQSQLLVPAYLNQRSAAGLQRLDLRISTEKLGPVVMLRIDEVLAA